ncbi:hypothetical protein PFISCL1PPCAC_22381 [Pristionchus fissidentatus]|uniref:Uncharacterized protein n=1 Tax=Pristionchus fissidentatus TaxID=1538716 RepID=A0AAV5WGC0_9BILA|nr:hypothetical protein PFISCL1PPCAC_22381 [Pristionchus fissidentatus]
MSKSARSRPPKPPVSSDYLNDGAGKVRMSTLWNPAALRRVQPSSSSSSSGRVVPPVKDTVAETSVVEIDLNCWRKRSRDSQDSLDSGVESVCENFSPPVSTPVSPPSEPEDPTEAGPVVPNTEPDPEPELVPNQDLEPEVVPAPIPDTWDPAVPGDLWGLAGSLGYLGLSEFVPPVFEGPEERGDFDHAFSFNLHNHLLDLVGHREFVPSTLLMAPASKSQQHPRSQGRRPMQPMQHGRQQQQIVNDARATMIPPGGLYYGPYPPPHPPPPPHLINYHLIAQFSQMSDFNNNANSYSMTHFSIQHRQVVHSSFYIPPIPMPPAPPPGFMYPAPSSAYMAPAPPTQRRPAVEQAAPTPRRPSYADKLRNGATHEESEESTEETETKEEEEKELNLVENAADMEQKLLSDGIKSEAEKMAIEEMENMRLLQLQLAQHLQQVQPWQQAVADLKRWSSRPRGVRVGPVGKNRLEMEEEFRSLHKTESYLARFRPSLTEHPPVFYFKEKYELKPIAVEEFEDPAEWRSPHDKDFWVKCVVELE